MTANYLVADTNAIGWEQTIYAFLAEKARRSSSKRTLETYSRMLYQFFGTLGKTPDQVAATEVSAPWFFRQEAGPAPGAR